MDLNKEYILCAAIHFNDSKEHPHQPKNIKFGYVIAGRRHHNCFTTVGIFDKTHQWKKLAKGRNVTQGFITSKDRFLNRKESYIIAIKQGQTTPHDPNALTLEGLEDGDVEILISEDLYSEDLW